MAPSTTPKRSMATARRSTRLFKRTAHNIPVSIKLESSPSPPHLPHSYTPTDQHDARVRLEEQQTPSKQLAAQVASRLKSKDEVPAAFDLLPTPKTRRDFELPAGFFDVDGSPSKRARTTSSEAELVVPTLAMVQHLRASPGNWWKIKEILANNEGSRISPFQYLVSWEGEDPETYHQWPFTWVSPARYQELKFK